MMTIDDQLALVNAALDRCDVRSRATGEIRWSHAICALLGVKLRLILTGIEPAVEEDL